MNVSSKLVSNTAYLFLDWFFATVLSLAFWVMLGRILVPEQYGIVATSINLMVLITGISHFGLNITVSKLIPEFVQKRNYKKSRTLIRFGLSLILTSNILIAILISLGAPAIASLIKIPTAIVYICSIGLFVLALSNYFGSVNYGFQNMKKYFLTNFIGHVIKLVASFFLIVLGMNYFGAMWGFALGFLVVAVLRFDRSWFIPNSAKIEKRQIIFHYALPALMTSLAYLVFTNLNYVILPFFKNQEITGLFAIAMTFTSPIGVIPSVLSNALFPITSQLAVNNAVKKQSHLISLVIRYTFLFILPLMIFLTYYPEFILTLFRPEYSGATSLFSILGVSAFFFGLYSILLSNLYAIRKTKLNRNIYAFGIIVFLILAFTLTPMFSALGLSVALLLSNMLLSLLGYFFLRKYLKIRLGSWNIAKLVFANLIFFVFLLISSMFAKSILIKSAIVLSGGLVYFLALIPMRFYKREDVKMLDILSEKSPIFKTQIKSISKILSRFVKD